MNPIEAILSKHGVMYLDGGTATELENRGCDINDPLWASKMLFSNPEAIRQVHMDYLRAGSDTCLSNSYQATLDGFRKHGFDEAESRRLMRLSVELVARARDEFWSDPSNRAGRSKPVVTASIGPYGAYLADGSEYRGNYGVSRNTLADFHRERMALLVEAGAEFLACETLPCLKEAEVLAELVGNHPGLYCWISFSCKDSARISDGTPIEECAQCMDGYDHVAAIGVNCVPPESVEGLIGHIRASSSKPVVVYPNSGEQYDARSKDWHGSADGITFAERAISWYKAGARIFGGCCRTTPAHIKEVSQAISALVNK